MPDREPRRRGLQSAGVAGSRGPFGDSHELTRGLVQTVNHHLRTPLTVISGHVELWSDRLDELPGEFRQSFAAVQQAGRRLSDVGVGICDLIGAAYIDPEALTWVHVAELVADEAAALADRARERGVRLVLDGDQQATCVADPGRLRHALRELLDNAVTYAPEHSTVRVNTSVAGTWVQIAVSDEGEGIDAADRERLVRPFERGSHSRQPVTGLGMGLALVSAAAGSHGGRLTLSDRCGGGLRACLQIPTDFAELAAHARASRDD